MVRCEMEGGKFLVGVSVDPALQANIIEAAAVDIVVAMFKRVAVHGLKALRVVLEGGQRKRSEISLLFERQYVHSGAFFIQEKLQLLEFVVVDAFKYYLSLGAHGL